MVLILPNPMATSAHHVVRPAGEECPYNDLIARHSLLFTFYIPLWCKRVTLAPLEIAQVLASTSQLEPLFELSCGWRVDILLENQPK